ncbi:hypothetical protein C2G38_2214044 [Gigaspora rosea]|uniref:Uncharacterized protein n=1 Tax=Gigaspora rosea TaxID=44941 RepID=A0A397UEI5_9GLOM|nr:hypothetical protein C2G38_2214044 [Gigaspora rosea]
MPDNNPGHSTEEINNILNKIRVEKFTAVVIDHGLNIRRARRLATKIYNSRFKEFATRILSTSIIGQFCEICETAASMWQDLGYDEASCEDLLTELRAYKRKEKAILKNSKRKKESPLIRAILLWDSPHNKQLEEINYNKLSIEEIVDLSNPAFVGSNNPFVNNQSSALDTATKRLSSGNLDYNPILTEDN